MLLDLLSLLALSLPTSLQDDEPSLRELKASYEEAEDVERRREILQTLTSRAIDGGKQAPAAMEIVALGLADDSYDLRREAVRLLGLGGDREVAVKSLAEALDAVKADRRTAQDALRGLDDLRGALRGLREAGGEGGGEGEEGEGSGDPLEDLANQFRSRVDHRVQFLEDVMGALAELPDDRSVKALQGFLERSEGGLLRRYRLPAARALTRLGTRAAMESVRAALEAEAKRAAEAEEEDEDERSRGGRRGGRRGGGLADLLGDLQGGGGDEGEDLAVQLHEVLIAAAEARELPEPPAWDAAKAPKEWKKWLNRHRKTFPSKHGRIERRESDEG